MNKFRFGILSTILLGVGALSAQTPEDIVIFKRTGFLAQDYAAENTTAGTGMASFKNRVPEGQYEIINLTTGEHQIIEYYGPPHPDFPARVYFVNAPASGIIYDILPIKPAGNFLWFRAYGASVEVAEDLDPDDDNTIDYFSTVQYVADEQGKAGKIKIGGRELFVPKTITVLEDLMEQYEQNLASGGVPKSTGSVIRQFKGTAKLDVKLSNTASTPGANNSLEAAMDSVKALLQKQGYIEVTE